MIRGLMGAGRAEGAGRGGGEDKGRRVWKPDAADGGEETR